ncbi:MAG TPA: hydrogenase nickel incorporation protein HypB [Acidobacteriota bacterium]|nr:hydrogenase nickel incorporation protein HypB [Acidobacteriota bacterium]
MSSSETRQVKVLDNILKANDYLARRLRRDWTEQGTFVVNLLSSPGSGKTSLLEATLPTLQQRLRVGVLEGDLETERDAERIRAKGIPALQITTGGTCHLESHMIEQAWEQLRREGPFDILFIENVGNLVCPASYDLGEHLRAVLLSVPEGDDKPAKYPKAFRSADACLITKCDLLPHFDFDLDAARRQAQDLRPDMQLFQTSATSGQGLDEWLDFVDVRFREVRSGGAGRESGASAQAATT